jgi:hypothetical protein
MATAGDICMAPNCARSNGTPFDLLRNSTVLFRLKPLQHITLSRIECNQNDKQCGRIFRVKNYLPNFSTIAISLTYLPSLNLQSQQNYTQLCIYSIITLLRHDSTIIKLRTEIEASTSVLPGGAVGWSTALQARRSPVRLPRVSLGFFIDLILPAALWLWGPLSLWKKRAPGIFPGGKCGRLVVWQPSHPQCLAALEATFWNPKSVSCPLMVK